MGFTDSGIEAAGRGMSAISNMEKDWQQSVVRPRELEAATSLAESRATVAKQSIVDMQEMSGITKIAAQKFKDSGEAQTVANGNKFQVQEMLSSGHIEAAMKLSKQQAELDQTVTKTQSEAASLEADKNDLISNTLDGMTSLSQYEAFAKAQLKEAGDAMRSGTGTPESAMRVARAREALGNIDGWKRFDPDGSQFDTFKQAEIHPLMQSLKSSKQKAIDAKNAADEQYKKDRLAAEIDWHRDQNAARMREAAATRERASEDKTFKYSQESVRLEDKYQAAKTKLQEKLDLLPEKDSHWMGLANDTDNPEYAKAKANLDQLDAIHTSNMEGLSKVGEGKGIFTAKPYIVSEKPALVEKQTSKYSSTQEDWLAKAQQANPKMSLDDIIKQGKKLGKL